MKLTYLEYCHYGKLLGKMDKCTTLAFPRQPPSFCSHQKTPIPMFCFRLVCKARFLNRLKSVDGSNVSRATTKPKLSSFGFTGAALCYGTTRVFRECSLVCLGAESQKNLCGRDL